MGGQIQKFYFHFDGSVGILALLSAFFNGLGSIQYIVVRKWNLSHRFITWVTKESLTIYFWYVFVLKVMESMGH